MTDEEQTAVEKMAKELEELKSWVAAHDELDRHRQLALLIRQTLPDAERRTIISIFGVVELKGEPYPDDPRLVNPTLIKPLCPICRKQIKAGSSGFRVKTSLLVFGGGKKEESIEYHGACVNKKMFDSSEERYFEG